MISIVNAKIRKNNKDHVLKEAWTRLCTLCENNFASIAKELDGIDQYKYARAYSAGLQEFIEAFTYYEYINSGRIFDWETLQNKLTFSQNASHQIGVAETDILIEQKTKTINCLVQPIEFMLGIGDLGGEIMRRCVNSLGIGNVEGCFQACTFLQSLYTG